MFMLKNLNSKKAQISIDAILAIMFLLLVSTLVYHNVFNTTESFKEAEIADRVYSIADSFENYALISYSKDMIVTIELKPIGVNNYTIYFGNKSIVVNSKKNITFNPTNNGVNISGDEVKNSGKNMPNNVINISYGIFMWLKTPH
ncbi:hypothetical protein [Methanococcus aeolicus]|uniref:hypothetical protein n=1 Tax=Methanococcus aeolicus TaxID=42879 RepID=UPI0021C7A24A|nr:hypothetical protein [Methanococcus aeolicus]UXM84437.1 hypothetical protein N6C89_06765 [Methanococcus aeolicus]